VVAECTCLDWVVVPYVPEAAYIDAFLSKHATDAFTFDWELKEHRVATTSDRPEVQIDESIFNLSSGDLFRTGLWSGSYPADRELGTPKKK